MSIFLVTPLQGNFAEIEKAIAARELDVFKMPGDAGFLVSHPGTTIEMSNSIGITKDGQRGELGPALVTAMSSYYGIAATSMWEWIKSRLERDA